MLSTEKVIGSISETFNGSEFEWMINISDKVLERDYLKSPEFSFSSSSWYVIMYPTQSKKEGVWISLFLNKIDLNSENRVKFSFEMTFQDNQLQKSEAQKFRCFSKTAENWGFCEYILRQNVLDELSKKPNCSQLMIKIRMENPAHSNENEATLLRVKNTGKEILSQNYRDMLLNSEDHDLILKVKDKELKAHRLIMRNRCPVFKCMLSHEMLENNKGVVEIADCDPLAFEQFLFYVYTGELEILDISITLGLYYIADKYDIGNLKEECAAFIKKSLTVQVICDVISLALNHNDHSLLECATNYFMSNAKKIFVTVEWQSYIRENPIQANELIIKAFDKTSCCDCSSKDDDEDEDEDLAKK